MRTSNGENNISVVYIAFNPEGSDKQVIRKGKFEEIKEIMYIFKEAIIDMEGQGIYQWDNVYPNEEVIAEDIKEGTLFVYEDENLIKGLIVLSEHEDEEYKELQWQFNRGKHLIVHRLCVDPKCKGKGIAKKLVEFAEKYGEENRYEAIRLDAFIPNKRACRMYENAGYKIIGIVNFRKGQFCCYEKGLGQ